MARIELRTGVYSTSLSLAAAGALVLWPNAPLIGYSLFIAAAALAVWGIRIKGVGLTHIIRGRRAMRAAYAERTVFENEIVCVTDLVNDALPMVYGKRFKRCIIRGPARIWFKDQCILLFGSAATNSFVEVPEGADARGAVPFYDVVFDRCYFHDLFIEVTPTTHAKLVPQVDIKSLTAWNWGS